jgi:hypothetical protein
MNKYLVIILLLLSSSVLGCLTNAPEENAGGTVNYLDIPVSEAKIKVDSRSILFLMCAPRKNMMQGILRVLY